MQGRREPTTGANPVQNDDLWTRDPVPLEIADDKQYTNILPRFSGPSEHSGPLVFCPPPMPLSPALSTCFLEAKKFKVDSWINLVEISFSQSNFSWLMNDSFEISKTKSMLR
jgi:hypothetical protein